ncbi:MAG: DUF4294 domain-containing protein [Bacteroidetes bacterium]|nr:DUF4294 domain-containing protein [Bacteroidota bacterium]
MKKITLLITSFFFITLAIQAQDNGHIVPYIIDKFGDTVAIWQTPEVTVEKKMDTELLDRQKKFLRLLADVYKVMPLAKECSKRIDDAEAKASTMSKRERKKFLKEEEKKVFDQYKPAIEDLSPRQGKVLVKLIDRETGKSSYKLIKEYKNGLSAFMWQGVAAIFSVNLKDRYDPAHNSKDRAIETACLVLGY